MEGAAIINVAICWSRLDRTPFHCCADCRPASLSLVDRPPACTRPVLFSDIVQDLSEFNNHIAPGAYPGFYIGGHSSWAPKAPRKVGIGRGVPLPNRLGIWGSVVSSLSAGSGRQRIFGIFEAHRTLLVERTVLLYWIKQVLRPNKASFSVKKSTQPN